MYVCDVCNDGGDGGDDDDDGGDDGDDGYFWPKFDIIFGISAKNYAKSWL